MECSKQTHSFSFVFCLLDLFLVNLSVSSQVGGVNSKGRVFMLSFLLNNNMAYSENSLIIMSDEKTTVFVYMAYNHNLTRYFMKNNDTLMIKLPLETTATTMGLSEQKTTSLYSTEPVSVYGITFQENSSGAFMSIPMDKWGDHYVVATFDGGGEIAIIAAEDETSVTVVYKFVRQTICFGNHRTSPHSKSSFSLNHDDVLRIACQDDMTGTIVKGSKPVGVISGNICAKIPNGSLTCDHIVEMMIPSRILGQEYILAAVAGRKSRVRVIYVEQDATIITLLGGPAQEVGKSNNFYREWSLEPDTILKLNTSKPVLVVVYTLSSNGSADPGNAAMVVLAPVESYDSEYGLSLKWEQLMENKSKLYYDLSIYSHPQDDILNHSGYHINSRHELDMTISQANVTTSKYLAKDTFPKSSNLIMSVSTYGSSMIFPVGMGINFYTGVDNCSSNPCHNEGICYMIGFNLKCFCGDQLNGTMCENDIYNGCQSSPCRNGGICTDQTMDFKCECQVNFTGPTCDSVVTTTLSTTASTTPTQTTVKTVTTPLSTTSIKTTMATPKTTSAIPTMLTFKAALTSPLYTTSTTTATPTTKTPTTEAPTNKTQKTKTPTIMTPATRTPTTKTQTTMAPTTKNPTTKASTTKTPTSTNSIDVPSKKLCRCVCNDITREKIHEITEKTKKDLGVNPKMTHKIKIKSESTYDERPSAIGIGILGVLFLSLVFGSIFLLDLLSAIHYITTWLKNRRPQHNSKRAKHMLLKDSFAITYFNKEPYSEEYDICSRSYIIMPRIKLAIDGLTVVGKDNKAFVMRRPSWSLRKEMPQWDSDSGIHHGDLDKHDAEDFCSGYVSDDTAELFPSSLFRSQSELSLTKTDKNSCKDSSCSI